MVLPHGNTKIDSVKIDSVRPSFQTGGTKQTTVLRVVTSLNFINQGRTTVPHSIRVKMEQRLLDSLTIPRPIPYPLSTSSLINLAP